jgi:hypothetical protein
LEFGKQKALKPGFHFIGSGVETRRFQAMRVNCIQLVQPNQVRDGGGRQGEGNSAAKPGDPQRPDVLLGVAVQVAFKSKFRKPGYHISGSRVVETMRLSSYE